MKDVPGVLLIQLDSVDFMRPENKNLKAKKSGQEREIELQRESLQAGSWAGFYNHQGPKFELVRGVGSQAPPIQILFL